MTNEEAIEWFMGSPFYSKDHEPYNMAIKAIKQADVIEKIRAEIADLEEGISSYRNDRPRVFKDEVLQIIDKYRKEQE